MNDWHFKSVGHIHSGNENNAWHYRSARHLFLVWGNLFFSRHVHLGDQDIRGVESAVDPLRFLADRRYVLEQVVNIARDGQVLDPSDDLAFLDLESQCQRIGKGAGDGVALPDAEQVFDDDTFVNAGKDVFQRGLAGLDDQVGERRFGWVEQACVKRCRSIRLRTGRLFSGRR